MIRFEKYKKEILETVRIGGRLPAVVENNIVPCEDAACAACELKGNDSLCAQNFIKWAMEEVDETKSCEFCEYNYRDVCEYPCSECRETYPNQFKLKSKEPELKPCPFCGGEAKVIRIGYDYIAQCGTCCAEIHVCETKEEAVEAWNRRAK